MIKTITLNGFRGFESLKGSGFARVNVFGGKNNVGKTSLLEALLLMCEPSSDSIIRLLGARRVSAEYLKSMPGQSLDNFFYDKNGRKKINLSFTSNENTVYETLISKKEELKEISEFLNSNNIDNENGFTDIALNSEIKKSFIHILSKSDGKIHHEESFLSSEQGIVRKSLPATVIRCFYLPASARLAGKALAEAFDMADTAGKSMPLLKAFQLIDSTIESVKTRSIGEPNLYIKRSGEAEMSINFYGDAMNKIADYILRIINNEGCVLLLDEIENGIHHESQVDFWTMLFDLCEEHNVQIFATSHSGEMITAFNQVVQAGQRDGAYFRLSRYTSGPIVMQKIASDALENKILHHDPYRR